MSNEFGETIEHEDGEKTFLNPLPITQKESSIDPLGPEKLRPPGGERKWSPCKHRLPVPSRRKRGYTRMKCACNACPLVNKFIKPSNCEGCEYKEP